MKKRATLISICCLLLVVVAYATTSTASTSHSVSKSNEYSSKNACPSLDWITATYKWIKGGVFAPDKCDVFMQTQGITAGQTNTVTVSVWHDGEVYNTDTKTSAKTNIKFSVSGKLWVAVQKVQADFDASYVALGNQHWTVTGD